MLAGGLSTALFGGIAMVIAGESSGTAAKVGGAVGAAIIAAGAGTIAGATVSNWTH